MKLANSDSALGSSKKLSNLKIILGGAESESLSQLSITLQADGALVSVIQNGKEFVKKALKAVMIEAPYDITLVDLNFNDIDGLSAAALLRMNNYKLPIISLAARDFYLDEVDSLQAGCNSHLGLKMFSRISEVLSSFVADLQQAPELPLRNVA